MTTPSSEPTPENLRAAIRLLDDPDPRIVEACRRRLLEHPESARPLLRQAWEHANSGARPRIKAILEAFGRRDWLADFVSFAEAAPDCTPVDLETGALLIARFGRLDLDTDPIVLTLDGWAEELRPKLVGKSFPAVAADLARFFHQEKKISGNQGSYNEPENSFLDQILRRRRGIPIGLSVLYLLVARRIGLPMEGVGMPGHFLVRLRGPRSLLLDPFHNGRVITRAECIQYLQTQGFGFHASYLDPVDDRRILVRMLTNLIHVYGFREDRERISCLTEARNALVRE